MGKNRIRTPDAIDDKPLEVKEPDYSVKESTPREQIVFGIKLLAGAGIIFLVFWLMEKY